MCAETKRDIILLDRWGGIYVMLVLLQGVLLCDILNIKELCL